MYGERVVVKEAKCGAGILTLDMSRQICECGSHSQIEACDEGAVSWRSD